MPIALACPYCQTAVQTAAERWLCPQCGRNYTSTLGIPSLGGADLDATPTERALIDQLVAAYPTTTIEEMSQARLAVGKANEELRQFYANYHRTLRQRGPAFLRMFQERMAQADWDQYDRRAALDIGCGIGGGILALAREFEQVVGLDISLSSLIIARKVIEEAGLKNVTLVHASALQLPFLPGTFDFSMAINVLEHIFTPEGMLSEVCRVLAARGVFAGDSRNRFDLFFKEPHVGLRWVGYLPRQWMARYVRWRIGMDYQGTYLLAHSDLAHALQTAFGTQWRVVLPDASAYGAPARLGAIAERIDRVGVLHPLLIRIAPSHIALARRA